MVRLNGDGGGPASRLASVPEPGASCDGSALPRYTCRVKMDLEHTTDLLHPLPAHADAACGILATWVIRAHTSHLATSGTQYTPDRLIRYAVITRDVTERFPLLDPLEHGCPCRGRDLPARISYGLRVAR